MDDDDDDDDDDDNNNNELCGLYSLLNIIWFSTAISMTWVDIWHVHDRRAIHTEVLCENFKQGDRISNPVTTGRIIT